jgi:Fe(3+) dicitrate transport protein
MSKMFLFFLCTTSLYSYCQNSTDTLKPKELKEIMIKSWMRRDIDRLPDVQNNIITAGKKNELINLASTNANISLKTGRQLFSKVPGVFVYDMDGSGNQINIATRGLDPHRSWEFNIRQNGVIINSDMYGYPASHYSAPMESFEKIEIVRGTGALQYGAQFGGMVNYVTKKPDSSKAFSLESMNTIGSFGLLSSYNAVGGTIKKFSYYAYYFRRHSAGYRKNSESDANAQFIQLQYRFSDNVSLKAEIGRSKYQYHIPGPLNDSMFDADARTSTRSRNYFSPDIYIPSVKLNWKIAKNTDVSLTASGVFGNRSSVQFDAFANVRDAIDPATNSYKNRQVDIDRFNSRTIESRLLHQYNIGRVKSKIAGGIVYMNNDLHRRQLGKGTTGMDYDLALVEPDFGRDIHFLSNNLALFAENAFSITEKWTISPGVRWENGESKMRGIIKYYPPNELPTTIDHQFTLLGISTQYLLNNENSFMPVFLKPTVLLFLRTLYRPLPMNRLIKT